MSRSKLLTTYQEDRRALLTGVAVVLAIVGNSIWMVGKFTETGSLGINTVFGSPVSLIINPPIYAPLMLFGLLELKLGRFNWLHGWIRELAKDSLGAALVAIVLPLVGGLFWGGLTWVAVTIRYGLENMQRRDEEDRTKGAAKAANRNS